MAGEFESFINHTLSLQKKREMGLVSDFNWCDIDRMCRRWFKYSNKVYERNIDDRSFNSNCLCGISNWREINSLEIGFMIKNRILFI
jgi:hypothetical protein